MGKGIRAGTMAVLANLIVLPGWPGPQVRIQKRVVNRVNLNQAPPLAEIPLGGEQRDKQQQERPGVPVGNFG